MNKRIKKKKAKQALERQQAQLDLLLENPEQMHQALYAIAAGLSNACANLAVAFENMANNLMKRGEQLDKENSSKSKTRFLRI